jgi:hypothetical protein
MLPSGRELLKRNTAAVMSANAAAPVALQLEVIRTPLFCSSPNTLAEAILDSIGADQRMWAEPAFSLYASRFRPTKGGDERTEGFPPNAAALAKRGATVSGLEAMGGWVASRLHAENLTGGA